MKKSKMAILLALSLLLLVGMRTIPLWRDSLTRSAYDFGFYLYAIKHVSSAWSWNFLSPSYAYGTLGAVFYIFQLLHVSPEFGLSGLLFISQILIGVSLYFLLRRENFLAAIFAVLLYSFSIPQSEGYFLFLLKSSMASIFLILAIKFLMERRYIYFIVLSSLVFLTHRTTAVILGVTALGYLFYSLLKQKRFTWLVLALLGLISGLCLAYVFFYNYITGFLFFPNPAIMQGIFLADRNPLAATWLYLGLSLLGLYWYVKNRKPALLVVFWLVTALWIIFALPFYNRIILYFDLALVIFAAFGLVFIYQHLKKWQTAIVLTIVFLIAAGQAIEFNLEYKPLISRGEIQEIQSFTAASPGSFVLALSTKDAPWLLGYAESVRLAAPGLFEQAHTYQDWQAFWSGQGQQAFLTSFPKPLFLYLRSGATGSEVSPCLKQQSRYFYQYLCN